MIFTNRQMIDTSPTIFAHTDAYNLPAMFANRFVSRRFLEEALTEGGARIVLISDILGSGKTFLMNMVQGKLGLADTKALSCGRVSAAQLTTRDPVFIDEWDIKANPRRMVTTLSLVEAKLASDETAGPVVLLGDLTLRHESFQERLRKLNVPLETVPMEPLDPGFFDLAMRNRLKRALVTLGIVEENVEAIPDQVSAVLDERLKVALVPEWTTTSANFRDVFRALTEMAALVRVDDAAASVGEREARLWLDHDHVAPKGLSDDQSRFIAKFVDLLRNMIASSGWPAVRPFDAVVLQRECGFTDMTVDDFRSTVLDPICRAPSLLAAMGSPRLALDGSGYDRYAGPYLPGTFTRVRTAFGG